MWCFLRKPLPTKKKMKNSSSTSFHDIAKLPKLIQEFLLPFSPLDRQKKKKCFPSLSMSVGQCGVTLENHCPPRQESVHRQKKKNCFSTFSMSAGQCLIRKPLPPPTQASSSVEEEEFFSFLFGRRNVVLLFLCM